MKKAKIDNSGAIAAQEAIAKANAAATNLQKNFQTDLKNENLTKVTAGGEPAVAIAEPGNKWIYFTASTRRTNR